MDKTGKYIYGIINSNTAFNLFIPQDFLKPENESNGVRAISYQDISAVVRDSKIVDYTHMFKDALARALIEHQKVIEKIMSIGHSIIPIRLGTFATDEVEVKDILTKGYGLIKEIIPKISNKIEIDVAATWTDFTTVIKEAGEMKDIKELKEKLLNDPKKITVDDQMKIGVMIRNALDQMRKSYASKIQDVLKTVCIDYRQHELMDDKMVINLAFLVDKAKEKEFYDRLENLNTEFQELLNFRCIGPLPCYSFYTLEIKKMNFADVDRARKRLGFSEDSIMKDEIKIAYHREAFIHHPDKNPQNLGRDMEFEEIKKSYDVLIDFAQACLQAGSETITFREDEFNNNAVLVKIKE